MNHHKKKSGLYHGPVPSVVKRVSLPSADETPERYRRELLRFLQTGAETAEGARVPVAASKRLEICGQTVRFGREDVEIHAVEHGGGVYEGRVFGVARCGKRDCPHCGGKAAADSAAQISSAITWGRARGREAVGALASWAYYGPRCGVDYGLCGEDSPLCDGVQTLCDPIGRQQRLRPSKLSPGAVKGWTMVTLSIPHAKEDFLDDLVEGLLKSWGRVSGGRWWGRALEARRLAVVRALEVTWSARAGWHPHLHLLLATDKPLDTRLRRSIGALSWSEVEPAYLVFLAAEARIKEVRAEIEAADGGKASALRFELRDLERGQERGRGFLRACGWSSELWDFKAALFEQWHKAVGHYLQREASPQALDVQPVNNPSQYLVKAGLEIAGGALKRGKGYKRFSPLQLAHRAATSDTNDKRRAYAALYREYEHAFAGRHRISGVGRLMAVCGVDQDLVDEDRSLSEGPVPLVHYLGTIRAKVWRYLVYQSTDMALLRAVEKGPQYWGVLRAILARAETEPGDPEAADLILQGVYRVLGTKQLKSDGGSDVSTLDGGAAAQSSC